MPIDVRRFAGRFLTDASFTKELAFRTLFAVIFFLPSSISLFEIASWAFILLAAWSLAVGRDFSRLRQPFAACAVAYLFFACLSLTQSAHLEASWRGVFKVVRSLLLCFAAVYVVDSPARFKTLFKWFLAVAVLMAVDAMAQGWLKKDPLRGRGMIPFHGDVKRLTGPFRHANDFSAYLSFVIFLFLGVVLESRRLFGTRFALFCKAGLWGVTFCLFGTYSRGAWLAVAVTFVLLTAFKRSRLFAASLGIMTLWAMFFSPPLVRDRFDSLLKGEGTVVERKELWSQSLRMIRTSPWLGLGVNTYAKNQPHFKSPAVRMDDQYAHNGYLQMGAEIGLLGLAAFLVTVGAALVVSLSNFLKSRDVFFRNAGLGFVCGIVAFLIHSATDTNLQSLLLVNTLWLALGIAWAGGRLAREGRAG